MKTTFSQLVGRFFSKALRKKSPATIRRAPLSVTQMESRENPTPIALIDSISVNPVLGVPLHGALAYSVPIVDIVDFDTWGRINGDITVVGSDSPNIKVDSLNSGDTLIVCSNGPGVENVIVGVSDANTGIRIEFPLRITSVAASPPTVNPPTVLTQELLIQPPSGALLPYVVRFDVDSVVRFESGNDNGQIHIQSVVTNAPGISVTSIDANLGIEVIATTGARQTEVIRVLANDFQTGGTIEFDLAVTFNGLVPPVVQPTAIPQNAAVGIGGEIVIYSPNGEKLSWFASGFPANIEVRVASVGDWNGNGSQDFVLGSGPGVSSLVRVIDGQSGQELWRVNPFESSFLGGVFVAAGDINCDGRYDVVITPDEGGGPRVRVFDGKTTSQLADFFGIDDTNFRGGARPAVGDINGDGCADLVVAAGFGGGPRIAGFNGNSLKPGLLPQKIFHDFFAFEQELRNGTYVAVGDTNGDGFGDLIAGAGPGGGPRVSVFNGSELIHNVYHRVEDFFAGNPQSRDGVRVSAKQLTNDLSSEIVTSTRLGNSHWVNGYDFSPFRQTFQLDFDSLLGVFVG